MAKRGDCHPDPELVEEKDLFLKTLTKDSSLCSE